MKISQIEQLFNDCRTNDIPLDVLCLCGSAADNAVATIGERGRKFVQGEFTEEFYEVWYNTLTILLGFSDYSTPEACTWFEARGVQW